MAAGMRDEVTALEHSTLKVPYELLNKKFRTIQKLVDKEVSHVSSSLSDFTTCTDNTLSTNEDMITSIDGVVQRINILKRKVEEGLEDELECSRLCKSRIDHLKPYTSGEQSDGVMTAWRKIRLDRMLVDHFLREGHYSTAISLANASDLIDLVDVNVFQLCQRVEEGLKSHNTGPCLAWCHDNRSKLRRLKSSLEYRVRLQDFIELIRQERRLDAVKYAKKHLSNGGEELLEDLKSAMALLAFSPDTNCKKYKRLFSLKRWEELMIQFRTENLALYQLNNQSVLTATLQAGLSALKTPLCYKQMEQNLQCPVCSTLFNELASALPYSHSSQSYLICRISGEPMNEHNPPMLLPNGYVYGEQALLKLSQENGEMITCPRTGAIVSFNDVKKVFVM